MHTRSENENAVIPAFGILQSSYLSVGFLHNLCVQRKNYRQCQTSDAEKNAYLRYITEDNKPYVDEKNPSETLAYENLIIQWTTLKYYNSEGNRPNLTEVGEGNADFFMNGVHVQGYWVRDDINHRTVFFDSEGNEISLQRGRSWIVLASDKFLDVKYE